VVGVAEKSSAAARSTAQQAADPPTAAISFPAATAPPTLPLPQANSCAPTLRAADPLYGGECGRGGARPPGRGWSWRSDGRRWMGERGGGGGSGT
jgi:hypothetical protein